LNLKKLRFVVPVAVMFALAGLSANAKTHKQLQGCTDSPENSTLALGLLVAAAGLSFWGLRDRLAVRSEANGK
jgi:hypothetical protein